MRHGRSCWKHARLNSTLIVKWLDGKWKCPKTACFQSVKQHFTTLRKIANNIWSDETKLNFLGRARSASSGKISDTTHLQQQGRGDWAELR